MNNIQKWTGQDSTFAGAAFLFVLFLHGAVPFLMIPTLGQAVWTTGFSQSFANGPFFSIYSDDFGIPKPAAIAFGLAGAWPAGLLIRSGLHPADAYAGMSAFWLGLAFFSAYAIARKFGSTRPISLLGGITWMSMPIVWAHAGYSMVSLGIGLLSFYFLAAIKLFCVAPVTNKTSISAIALYFAAAAVSVFMDGYTFMMFATGATVLFIFTLVSRSEHRESLLRIALPVHIASFALAYALYRAYIGKSNFEAHSLDFFRGWGLDLIFIAIPTKGFQWLPDLLGISQARTEQLYFGDESVWSTTFSLPVILAGLAVWRLAKERQKMATGVLLIAVVGFYMALGPSLKINSTKPESLQVSHPGLQSSLMPADLAVLPTGNGWISENVPGFNVMRASYRWSALGIFAFWLLVMICLAETDKKGRVIGGGILIGLTLLNLPNLPKKLQEGILERSVFHQIDQDLVSEMRQRIQEDETAAFLPWSNDFFANYLAPRAGFRTFNIGGDKNLSDAQAQWPAEMLALGGELDSGKFSAGVKMLINGTADVLVVPYFDMLWSAHCWPCIDETTSTLLTSEQRQEKQGRLPGFICPSQRKEHLLPFVRTLRSFPYLEVADSKLFATVRLRPEFRGIENKIALKADLLGNVQYPVVLGSDLKDDTFILSKGWYALETHHVWSQSEAQLTLPVPRHCNDRQCFAVLKFGVFGASPQRPVSISFHLAETGSDWRQTIIASSGDGKEISIPLNGSFESQELSITIPDATSPQVLTGSADNRILGIGLQRIDLRSK